MTYTEIAREMFEDDWPSRWGGRPLNGYSTNQGSDADMEARILFREGSHYGTDYRMPLNAPIEEGAVEFGLYLSGDWNPSDTGKLPGVLCAKHEPAGHGNHRPDPHGFSIRTWFGHGTFNRYVGAYVYHEDQQNARGDTMVVAEVPLWRWVRVTHEWTRTSVETTVMLDEEILGVNTMSIRRSDDSAPDTLWLCGYHGGAGVSPANMAADVDDLVVLRRNVATPPPCDHTDALALLAEAERKITEAKEALQ